MTLRNTFQIIRRDSLTLITNMTGLSLGLAASILLSTFILFELSYDKYFSHADRIFRLNTTWIEGGESSTMPINLREAYEEIPGNIAGIETAVQIYRGFTQEVVRGEDRYKELSLLYADPDFFKLFDFKMVSGNPQLALGEPGTVVLTQKVAERIFGEDEAVGQSLVMDEQIYRVTAVTEDIPPNTHFQFDMLMSMQSLPQLKQLGGLEFFSYFLIQDGVDPAPVIQNIANENTRLLTEAFADFGNMSFESSLTALPRLHLHSGITWDLTTPGNIRTIYIMLVITLAVMGLALTNFINLYILNGARRSKEIGIRKVNGASRNTMIKQFYAETAVVVTIAFMAGSLLSILMLPAFANLMQRDSFNEVTQTPTLYVVLASIYLFTILVSGFYPALLLSKEAPVPLIQGSVNPAGEKKLLLQLGSVIQICIAIGLLAILFGINAQIRFLKNLSPGYNPDHIVLIYNLNQKLVNNFPSIQEQLMNQIGIEEVAASSHTIGRGYSGQGIMMYGDDPSKNRSIAEYRILPGICQLYQFNLIAGRFLEPGRKPDRMGVILNEAAVSLLGSTPAEIVGELVVMHQDPMEVIGVVEDFHFESAAVQIEPLVLTAYSDQIWNISIRYSPTADPQEIVSSIHKTMANFDPDYVMANRYAKDICIEYYNSEERQRKIVLFGSLFALLIVLLGIYALVSHNIVSKTKEIGIRKVMGGSTRQMITLIFTSTLKWTLIASLLGIPLSYFYLHRWLNDYTLRIPLFWWIFVFSLLIILFFQSLITFGQTWRTSRRNPVEALRYE